MDPTSVTATEYRSNFSSLRAVRRQLGEHTHDTVVLVGLAVAGLLTGLWASSVILDDALITFRVAENLAYGRGFVYNLGERVQVTTTPLYALVVAAGTWVFGSAPRAALVLNITLSALIPMLAYDVGRRLAGRMTGLGGGLLLMLAPLLIRAFSMESYLYVALILAAVDAYAAGYFRLAGTLAGLTALVRGDGALLAACLLSYDFLARLRLRWRLIVPAVAIPAAWYLFALLYYGSPFPATLGAKVAQGEFNWLGQRFIDGLGLYWDHWTRVQDYDTFYLFPALVLIALPWVIWRERLWLILVGRDLLYVLVFVGLAVPAAEWYYAPLMPGVALLSARAVQLLAQGAAWLLTRLWPAATRKTIPVFKQRWPLPKVAANGLAGLLLAVLLATVYPASRYIVDGSPDWKARVYPEAARWIAANTNASANLGTIDIGHLGYWSGRPIIDIVGLAQPDVAARIAGGDFGYAIRQYQPDLVLLGYSWLPEVQSADWFQAAYTPRHFFSFAAMDEPLLLFSRSTGVKVQPELLPAAEVHPLDVDFNRQVTLTGYQSNQPVTGGSNLIVTLLWQATAPIELDFTVFVQLVNARDGIVAQGDSKPQQGFYGTPYWQQGEQIVDSHIFPVPVDVPPGAYEILVGFYNAADGRRLQILDEAGVFKGDHVRLGPVEIQAQ